MPDYQKLFERLQEAVFFAQKELEQRNYGNAERILSEVMLKGTSLCNEPAQELPEHSSLAYARRHGL